MKRLRAMLFFDMTTVKPQSKVLYFLLGLQLWAIIIVAVTVAVGLVEFLLTGSR